MPDRTLGMLVVAALGLGCGHPPVAAPASSSGSAGARDATDGAGTPSGPAASTAAGAGEASEAARTEASQDERLAAIQKAMNELDEAAQGCWASAATQRFDIEGEVALQIEIAAASAKASVVQDSARDPRLASCLVAILSAYRWAPPLHGQTIQLPFKFRAPDGQNTIDRSLVPWTGQGTGNARVSVAVLLDENNSGNDAASMFELAIAAGGATGLRWADRAELWYFLGPGTVTWAGRAHPVAAGDMMYAPKGSTRDVAATGADLHAMIVMVPGGREGAARGGALPTRSVAEGARPASVPMILPASAARTFGPATIYADAAVIRDKALAASILTLPAGGQVPEHVHAGETEMLYILAGGGTMTVNGVSLAVTPTSVVQIPKNTRHAFTATREVRAIQIYTPGGPEQRFKTRP
jgi:quercetin dioxygenase-like cupin family protein